MSAHDAEVFASLDHKPYQTHYLYFDTVIDRPVEAVWPHVLRIGDWMGDHRLVTIAGEAGQVGHFERVFPRDLGPQVSQPHYHLYGITAVVPLKYIALEVFPEKGGSYGNTRQWMGFDGIVLADLKGSTKVILLLLVVNMGREHVEQEQDEEATAKQIARYFENLRRLVVGPR